MHEAAAQAIAQFQPRLWTGRRLPDGLGQIERLVAEIEGAFAAVIDGALALGDPLLKTVDPAAASAQLLQCAQINDVAGQRLALLREMLIEWAERASALESHAPADGVTAPTDEEARRARLLLNGAAITTAPWPAS